MEIFNLFPCQFQHIKTNNLDQNDVIAAGWELCMSAYAHLCLWSSDQFALILLRMHQLVSYGENLFMNELNASLFYALQSFKSPENRESHSSVPKNYHPKRNLSSSESLLTEGTRSLMSQGKIITFSNGLVVIHFTFFCLMRALLLEFS